MDACDHVPRGELESCHGRIISLLEGGYDTSKKTNGLGTSVEEHLRALVERLVWTLYPAALYCAFGQRERAVSPLQVKGCSLRIGRVLPQGGAVQVVENDRLDARGRRFHTWRRRSRRWLVGVATTAIADKLALPTVGTSLLLAGEAKAVQRGKKIALKPDANGACSLYGRRLNPRRCERVSSAGVVRDAAARIAGPRLPRR